MHFLVSSCSKKCVKITRVSWSSSQKPRGDCREVKHLLKQWSGPGMALPLPGPLVAAAAMLGLSRRPQPRHPQNRSCPGHAPPQLLVLLLIGTARETGMSLTWGKRYSATTTVLSTLFSHRVQTHGPVPAAREAINSIPARTRTRIRIRIWGETEW